MSHHSRHINKQEQEQQEELANQGRQRDRHYAKSSSSSDSEEDGGQKRQPFQHVGRGEGSGSFQDDETERHRSTALLVDAMKLAWSSCTDPFPSASTFLTYLRSNYKEQSVDKCAAKVQRILTMNNITQIDPPSPPADEDRRSASIAKEVMPIVSDERLDPKSAEPVFWVGLCPLSQLKSFFPSWQHRHHPESINGNEYYPTLLLLVTSDHAQVVHAEIVDNGTSVSQEEAMAFLLNAQTKAQQLTSWDFSEAPGDLLCSADSVFLHALTQRHSGTLAVQQRELRTVWKGHSLPPSSNLNCTIPFFASLKVYLQHEFKPFHESATLQEWTNYCKLAIAKWKMAPLIDKDLFLKNQTMLKALAQEEITLDHDPVYAYRDGLSDEILAKFAWQ